MNVAVLIYALWKGRSGAAQLAHEQTRDSLYLFIYNPHWRVLVGGTRRRAVDPATARLNERPVLP